MSWTFPAAWEEAIWGAAGELLPAPALEARGLRAAIAERTRRYTSDRDRLAAPVPPRERARDLAARALFFSVADAAKIAVPLAELAGRGLLPARDPVRLFDVGAGAGAMTLGAAAALERPVDAVALDRDAEALAILARAAARGPTPVTVRTVVGDARSPLPAGAPFDLACVGSLLNELPDRAARVALCGRLLETLAPGGALIVIEPALRETARALHEVRDALLAAGAAHVFAPCTRQAAPCPALADPRDWCHEDRPFRPPPRLAALSRATGLRARGLKFAYLILRREPAPLVAAPPGRRALRVVSDALDKKGYTERILCGEAGRSPLRILHRDRSDEDRALGDSRRGDVLVAGDDGPLELVEPAKR